jgi:hypothetical protein
LASLSPEASPLLPYNCCFIPFKSAPIFLLHPRLFLPPQKPKLLACASLAIFSYCPSGLKGSFMTSLLYLATIHSYCPSGLRGSFILPLLYAIHKNHILGCTIAGIYVVEFQKRGLLHAHILIFSTEDCKPHTVKDVDRMITAELPNSETNKLAHETVARCMMHGPCEATFPNAPCMEEGKCKK